jgi:hypothetical protein
MHGADDDASLEIGTLGGSRDLHAGGRLVAGG